MVSTSIRDVVRPYADNGLVEIADDPATFVAACTRALQATPQEQAAWLADVDALLARTSWDRTFGRIRELVAQARAARRQAARSARKPLALEGPTACSTT